jgi:hypothetical protein
MNPAKPKPNHVKTSTYTLEEGLNIINTNPISDKIIVIIVDTSLSVVNTIISYYYTIVNMAECTIMGQHICALFCTFSS